METTRITTKEIQKTQELIEIGRAPGQSDRAGQCGNKYKEQQ